MNGLYIVVGKASVLPCFNYCMIFYIFLFKEMKYPLQFVREYQIVRKKKCLKKTA